MCLLEDQHRMSLIKGGTAPYGSKLPTTQVIIAHLIIIIVINIINTIAHISDTIGIGSIFGTFKALYSSYHLSRLVDELGCIRNVEHLAIAFEYPGIALAKIAHLIPYSWFHHPVLGIHESPFLISCTKCSHTTA